MLKFAAQILKNERNCSVSIGVYHLGFKWTNVTFFNRYSSKQKFT